MLPAGYPFARPAAGDAAATAASACCVGRGYNVLRTYCGNPSRIPSTATAPLRLQISDPDRLGGEAAPRYHETDTYT